MSTTEANEHTAVMFGGPLDGSALRIVQNDGRFHPPATLRVVGDQHVHVYHIRALFKQRACYSYKRAERK